MAFRFNPFSGLLDIVETLLHQASHQRLGADRLASICVDDGAYNAPPISFNGSGFGYVDGFYRLSPGVVVYTSQASPSFLMAASTTIRNDGFHRWAPTGDLPGSQVSSNTDVAIGRLADGILTVTRGDLGPGGAIKLGDPGTRPTAGSTYRGTIWIEEGAGGVADTFSVCVKSAADTYSWVDFAPTTIPAAHNVLDSTYHGDTLTGTVMRGDIIVGNSTPKWSRLAVGSTGTVLYSDGTDASWVAASSLPNVKQTEIDFGATPVDETEFVITDADVGASSQIIGTVAYEAPTGKDLDELEMDTIDLKFAPGVGSFTLRARGMDGYLEGKFKVNYFIG